MHRTPARHLDAAQPAAGARLALLALLLSIPTSAHAADDLAVERMRLASTRDGVIGVEAGTVPDHLAWEAGAWLGWSRDPLVVVRLSDGDRAGALVRNRLGGSLVGALGLAGRAGVALELPFVLHQDRDRGAFAAGGLAPLGAAGLGALRLVPRYALLRTPAHGIDLCAVVGVRLPIGAGDSFISSSGVEVAPGLAASRRLGRWRLAADLGAVLRGTRRVADLEAGSELEVQAGVARGLELGRRFPDEAMVSVSGAVAASRPFSREPESAFEARAAAAWDLRWATRLVAGVGVGLSEGWGAPVWRVFFATQHAPVRAAIAAAELVVAPPPAPAEVVPAPPPPEPAPAEPPPPLPPPPPPDADGDALVDAEDRCPSEAGPAENGGCPDRDRDDDGVVDRSDECPDVAGPAEGRGCPKSGAVRLAGQRIEVEGSVYFDTDRDVIQSRSFELLDSIAAVIAAHPEVGRIRVEGHTDATGSRAHNLDLSRRRAAAVVRHLTGRGVGADRLTSEGFGPDRPVADDQTADGRAKNRRVEFHVEQPPPAGE
jgi:outer membrane protein OmpA-like peptidoglycan-associated protein